MTAAEAHAAAAMAEGLVLVRADNASGFKAEACRLDSAVSKRFLAHGRAGTPSTSGSFATTEEAALAVARFLGPEGVAAALAAAKPEPAPMTAAEARARGGVGGADAGGRRECDGLQVRRRANSASKPFEAHVKRAAKPPGPICDGGGGGARRRELPRRGR